MTVPEINSFNVNIDVRVQFKAKSSNITLDGTAATVFFNFDVGMCQAGTYTTYDGVNYLWNFINSYAVREAKDGLQFFDSSHHFGWRYFDDSVQEAYAQYVLEREIGRSKHDN
jgi:hypothetical protein